MNYRRISVILGKCDRRDKTRGERERERERERGGGGGGGGDSALLVCALLLADETKRNV